MKEFLRKVWFVLNHPVTDGVAGLLIYGVGGYVLMEFCSGEPHIPSVFFGVILFVSMECFGSFGNWLAGKLFTRKEA